MPMYSLVPADEEARNAPPREPVFAPDEMIKQPRSKTSLFESDKEIPTKNRGANLKCQICNKTYKNKKVWVTINVDPILAYLYVCSPVDTTRKVNRIVRVTRRKIQRYLMIAHLENVRFQQMKNRMMEILLKTINVLKDRKPLCILDPILAIRQEREV